MSDNKDIAPGTIGRVMFDTVLVQPDGYKTFVLGDLKVANKEEYIDAINRFTAKREVNNLPVCGQLVNEHEYPVTGLLDFTIDPDKVAFRINSIDPDDKGGIIASCTATDTRVGKILQQQIELGSSSFGIRASRSNAGKLEMMSFDLINTPEPKKVPEYQLHMTPRGQPTVYVGTPSDKPVLTVANYCKWYELYLVNPDGTVTVVDTKHIDAVCMDVREAMWIDHIYSPQLFYALAKRLNAYTCGESAEMIVGRWMLENNSLCEVADENKLYEER